MNKRYKEGGLATLDSVKYTFKGSLTMEVELLGFFRKGNGKGKVMDVIIRYYKTQDDGIRVLVDETEIPPNDLIRAYTALADTDPDPVVKPR